VDGRNYDVITSSNYDVIKCDDVIPMLEKSLMRTSLLHVFVENIKTQPGLFWIKDNVSWFHVVVNIFLSNINSSSYLPPHDLSPF